MAHQVDGLQLTYLGRRSWKAVVTANGRKVCIAPVAWSARGSARTQRVAFAKKSFVEMQQYMHSREPFIIALAEPLDRREVPPRFWRFVAVLKVRATGRQLSVNTIETELVQRMSADVLALSTPQ